MANNVFCIEVNQLQEFSIIGGTSETLQFFFYNSDGTPLDLESSTAKWRLCRLGQPNVTILDLDAEIFDNNGVVVAKFRYAKFIWEIYTATSSH